MIINKKKGVSPVIATVLLITLTVIAITIIFIWARSTIEDQQNKFGTSIKDSCDKLAIQVDLSGNNLGVVNVGATVPLYAVAIKDNDGDLHECLPFGSDNQGLSPGEAGSVSDISLECGGVNSGDVKTIIPVLKGDDDNTFNCEKNEITPF